MTWVKPEINARTEGPIIIGKYDEPWDYGWYHAIFVNGKVNFFIFDNVLNELVDLYSSNPIDDGFWHHIAATRSGTVVKLYVDDEKIEGSSVIVINPDSTGVLYIGGYPIEDDYYLDGIIDDVRILNRTLTEEEIAEIRREG